MEQIRDKSNSDRQAEQIQNVVAFLGQMTGDRVMPQRVHLDDDRIGWDSLGDYHDPTLRLERPQ